MEKKNFAFQIKISHKNQTNTQSIRTKTPRFAIVKECWKEVHQRSSNAGYKTTTTTAEKGYQ